MPRRSSLTSPDLSPRSATAGRAWLGALVIVVVTLLAYTPAMRAGYIWDDDDYVTGNAHLRSVDGLLNLWQLRTTHQYYPVVFTTFWIEYHLWGLHPSGFHVVNIILHAVNACLLWMLCTKLRMPGAWMIGAIFALHPVHVESVAWITERKNVLSGFFYFVAAWSYLNFGCWKNDQPRRVRWRWYAIALLSFVLALLSKSVTCSLPLALVIVMLYLRKPLTVQRLAPLAPMLVIGLLLALHTAHLERANVGAVGPEFHFTFPHRLLIASHALLFYPYKIVAPWPLMFIYPRWELDPHSLMSYWAVIMVAAAFAIGALLYSRGVRAPLLALLFFSIAVFPALGFFNFYPMRFSFVADHFQYLASIGVIALVVGGVASAVSRTGLLRLLAAPVLIVLGTLTWLQSHVYDNEEILWRSVLLHNHRAWIAHANLGRILMDKGDTDEALAHLQTAFVLNPNDMQMQANLAAGLRTAARRADDSGQPTLAGELYRRSLLLPQPDPDTHMLYGGHLLRRGDARAAIEQFQVFCTLQPNDAFARFMLAEAHFAAGDVHHATEQASAAHALALQNGNAPLAERIEARSIQYRAELPQH
jgi:tetratricopeptide (TPR) repeat protein